MKNISIAFVAALSLAAVGCKKKGGDCDAAINNMMTIMKTEMKGMDEKMMAPMMEKVKGIAQKHCAEDKWPDDVLKCMIDSKDAKAADECEKKMPKDLKDKMDKDMSAAMGMGGDKPAGDKPMDKPADGSAAAGGDKPAAGGGDLPAECNDYKAAIEKLASCDKMPQQARDALKTAYDQASGGWANLPAEAKAGLATACKAGADAVMQSAKAVCGW